MNALQFHNVCFSYGNALQNDEPFESSGAFSLKSVDFSVAEGEFVAVLGENGSGKSTLARLSNGLLKPTSGEITVMGVSVGDPKNTFEVRKNVGIVFQNPDNQTVASIVEDDVAFGPENVGIPREEIGERIDFALSAVGMQEYRYATTSRLSGGQKQRIAIAGVLALKPKIMILDESTAMLDPKGRREVVEVVRRLNKEENITVLMITHFPEEALLADRAIVMSGGQIVMEGTPQEVFQKSEDLARYRLTVPRQIALCRTLSEVGVNVPDCLSVEEIAENIAREKGLYKKINAEQAPVFESETEQGKIVCENLHYTYNAASPFSTHALCGVSLEIASGEFFGVLGQTGSGKSTFVQHLNALLKLPTAQKKYNPKKKKYADLPRAKLVVNGFDLADKNTDFRALRKKVGMVFQYPEYQLFAETVFEDVAFGLRNFAEECLSEEEVVAAVKDALETVGLDYETYKNRSPFELSGGQKRRVAIAGVIVVKPEILVMDEPAAGLDPRGKEEIINLLKRVKEKWCKTVIIVSHDMDEIAENCSRAAIFENGKIAAVGTPKELFEGEKGKSKAELAGLEVPFIGALTRDLQVRGVDIVSNYTTLDFIRSVKKSRRTGQDLTAGGDV
ncbi:MAG: energy-coupling factor transporter ATPase [Clostridia bacterium]|nr:energy-coupling factor transporter ATPase [Clostridia bacterium]